MLPGRKFREEHYLFQTFFCTTSSSRVIHENVVLRGGGLNVPHFSEWRSWGLGTFRGCLRHLTWYIFTKFRFPPENFFWNVGMASTNSKDDKKKPNVPNNELHNERNYIMLEYYYLSVLLKELVKSKDSPSGRSIRPISFIFFIWQVLGHTWAIKHQISLNSPHT